LKAYRGSAGRRRLNNGIANFRASSLLQHIVCVRPFFSVFLLSLFTPSPHIVQQCPSVCLSVFLYFCRQRRDLICIRERRRYSGRLSLALKGIPRRQPHRRSGLATLSSVGAISYSHHVLVYTRGFAVFLYMCAFIVLFMLLMYSMCSFSTLILLVGSFDL